MPLYRCCTKTMLLRKMPLRGERSRNRRYDYVYASENRVSCWAVFMMRDNPSGLERAYPPMIFRINAETNSC